MSKTYSEFEIKHVVYPVCKDALIEVKIEVATDIIWDIDEETKKVKRTRRTKDKE